MWDGVVLGLLVQGLALLLLSPACEASTLGAVVHVVPLASSAGTTVRAHFMVISANPCPAVSEACSPGTDCMDHPTSMPLTGNKPGNGWCVRQWQKTVSSNYSATITLGSNVNFYLSIKTGPTIRANSGRLNQPPYVALPPPLRARVNCPHHIDLAVRDLDGDRVRCRFARAERGECRDCPLHDFLELDEERCVLVFTGEALEGDYAVVVMVEDFIPSPRVILNLATNPLSSVPIHLSLTVDLVAAGSSCSAEPMVAGATPRQGATLYTLPYEQANITATFISELEGVSEVAVVGPPGLFRSGHSTTGSLTSMSMAWVQGPNELARLLPVCFVVNTYSLQSDPRCVWLYQRELNALPAGTELTCQETMMSLVLPVASLTNIKLSELQLNSATCPVTYNDTHLTATIPLTGCGTKRVHSGNELVYTNVLQSVRAHSVVSRLPALVLPLACRIPGVQAHGPNYNVTVPDEVEIFGVVEFTLEIYFPWEGPLASLARRRRDLGSPSSSRVGPLGSNVDTLDLLVKSNCRRPNVEVKVERCVESSTADMANPHPIMEQGCSSTSAVEVFTTSSNATVYRMSLGGMETKGSTMYMQCTVRLCIATLPSDRCPDQCIHNRVATGGHMQSSLYTKLYNVSSAISLVFTTPLPATTKVITTTSAAATATSTTPTAVAPPLPTPPTAAPPAAPTTATTTVAAPAVPTIPTAAPPAVPTTPTAAPPAAPTTATTTVAPVPNLPVPGVNAPITTTKAPTTTTNAATTTTNAPIIAITTNFTTPSWNLTMSNAPKEMSAMTVMLIAIHIHMILQSIFLH